MYKQIILKKIYEYLRIKQWKVKKSGNVITLQCPFCKKEGFSATVIPYAGKINCFSCNTKYDLLQVVLQLEPELKDKSEEEVYQYLKELLKIDVTTEKEEQELDSLLEHYEHLGFDLVPIIKNGKRPIEKDWTNKTHKNKLEWKNWLSSNLNLGVKTGKISQITVLDLDTKEIPEFLKNINTLMQETNKGYHFFFKYDEDLPKTRVDEYKIDIETDGGQVVIAPSIVENRLRKMQIAQIIEMPKEVKDILQSKVTVSRKTQSEVIRENIETESFKIDPKDFELKNNGLEGCCNPSFVSLGGVLGKELTSTQVEFVLQTFNQHILENPMDRKAIIAMCRELEKYRDNDEQEMAHKILEYLKEVKVTTKSDLELVISGQWTKGEAKKRMNKILRYLINEEKIIQRGKKIEIIEDMNWEDTLINIGVPVDFKVPYLSDYAYFNWNDLIIIASKTKFGKCFKKGTKILMADGSLKKVEDIIVKDKVMGIDSLPREVQDTCIGESEMYEIQPKWSDNFTVNDEHILCLQNALNGEKKYITVKKYIKQHKTFKKHNKLYAVPINFSASPLPIDPYFLGLWLGDGNSNSVAITNIDEEIINYIYNYAKILNSKVSVQKQRNKAPRYSIVGKDIKQKTRNNSLQAKLKKLNLLNNKYIPKQYKINSRYNRLQILAGLLDADGNLNVKKRGYEFSNKNLNIIKGIQYIARSLGFRAYYKQRITTCNDKKFKSYRLMIGGECHLIPVKIKRKKAKKLRIWKNHHLYGFKVKKLKKDKYYGFMVNKDHLYLLGNFIVNHNTHLAMNMVKRLVDQGIKPHYVYSESGGRFAKIALHLGMKDGDFYHTFISDPRKLILPKKEHSVIIFDWIRPPDFAKTDDLFAKLIEKIKKTNGFLISFMQLKKDNSYFAENLLAQYPSLVCKYLYESEDGVYTKFQITELREGKTQGKVFDIPCQYFWNTKEVKLIEEVKEK